MSCPLIHSSFQHSSFRWGGWALPWDPVEGPGVSWGKFWSNPKGLPDDSQGPSLTPHVTADTPPLGIECPWHGTCHTAVSLALTVRLQGRSNPVQDLACFCGKKAGSPSALGQPALVHRLTPGQGGASLGLWLAGHGLIALQNSQISSSWIQWGFTG